MVFASPMPSVEELDEYNRNFFSNSNLGLDRNDDQNAWYRGVAEMHRRYMEKFISGVDASAKRILEIGPGTGVLTDLMKQHWSPDILVAVETDQQCRQILEEKGIRSVGDLSAAADLVGGVDLVAASNVMDHVSDPQAFLKEIHSLLVSGGHLFIEVPCRDWEFKDVWESHLLFFDREPMRLLLEQEGFEVVDISYFGSLIRELKPAVWWEKLFRFGRSEESGWELPLDGLKPRESDRVKAFSAHVAKDDPARWLRVVARKTSV